MRCGRLMPPAPVDLCDVEYETRLLVEAARKAGVDARALDAFSKSRKRPGPVIDHLTRDLLNDGDQEAADWVHYSVWGIEAEEHRGTLTVEKQWHYMEMLGHIAAAFHHSQEIRRLNE